MGQSSAERLALPQCGAAHRQPLLDVDVGADLPKDPTEKSLVKRDRRLMTWWWVDNRVIDQTAAAIGPTAFLVYCYLCRHCYDEMAKVSTRTMSLDLGLSSRTIERALRQIEKDGLIGVERNRGNSQPNIYTILDTNPEPVFHDDANELPAKKNQRPGSVYVIEDGSGLHKIGQTTDIDQRMAAFRNHVGHDVTIVVVFEVADMGSAERYLHRRFCEKRDHGEWFRLDSVDIDWLKNRATTLMSKPSGVGVEAPPSLVSKPIRKQDIEDIKEQTPPSADRERAIIWLWDYYIKQLSRNPKTYTLTAKRKQKARLRLDECLAKTNGVLKPAVAMMKFAIDKLAASDYHREHGHIDWSDNLFRSEEKLEWWIDRKEGGSAVRITEGETHYIDPAERMRADLAKDNARKSP